MPRGGEKAREARGVSYKDPMYFVMERDGTRPGRWISDYPFLKGINFTRGRPMALPVPSPLDLVLKPIHPQAEDHGPELPEYFQGRIPLFRRDLVEALSAAGVENLELYDAVLMEPDGEGRYETYVAVNILGVLSAAHLARAGKLEGPLMIRLEEAPQTILVHERLRERLVAQGFQNLAFYAPDDVSL